MARYYVLTSTQTGCGLEVEHNTGDRFASVSVYAGDKSSQTRMEADALESVANALQIAARRLREAGNNG
jgi:hypothetical protein